MSLPRFFSYSFNISKGSLIACNNSNTIGNLFTTNGNIGINVTNPSTTLHVNGNTLLSTNVTIGSNLLVIGPTLQIPTGNIATRPAAPQNGSIRYNVETQQFEGYGPGSAWGSLGGVIDIAQTTKILASATPSTTDGNLYFYTTNAERMRINSSGNIGIGTSSPSFTLDVTGTARFTNSVTTGNLEVVGLTDTLNLTATNISSNTINLSTGLTTASAQITNQNVTTSTIATLLNTNAVSTNISSATLNLSTGLTSTNLNSTNATIATILNTNAVSTNVSSATLNLSTGLTAASVQITNANVTTATIATLLNTNQVSTNISSATLNLSTGLTSTNLNSTNATIATILNTNAVSTNISSATLNLSTGLTSTNLNSTNATIATILNTNAVSTNVSSATLNLSTGLTAASVQITNANVTTATIATLLNTNQVSTNISSATLNLSSGVTTSNLKATGIVDTLNLTATNVSSANIYSTTISGSNLSLSGNANIAGTLTVVNITATNLMDTNLTAGIVRITTNLSAIGSSNTIGNIFTNGANVGIGTTAPLVPLHVNGNIGLNYGSGLVVPGEINSDLLRMLWTGSVDQVRLYTPGAYSGTPKLTLQGDGNVGIGTTTPASKLHISGAEGTQHGGNAGISIQNTASGSNNNKWNLRAGATGTDTPAGGFSIADENGYRMIFTSTGNIGIGTNTPTFTLDVNGTARISTGITTGGLEVTGLGDVTNLTTITATLPNLISTNVSSATLNLATGLTSGILKVTNLTDTLNLSATNITTTNLSVTTFSPQNITTTNISSGTLNLSTGLTSASAQITNVNSTNLTSTSILGTNISSATINLSNGLTSGVLRVTDLTDTLNLSATNITTTNLSVTTFSPQNITTTNISSSTLNLSTGLTSASAQITNVNSTNLTSTSILGTNISSATINLSNGVTSGILKVTNLTDTLNLSATNITTTNLSVTTFSPQNITTTNISSGTLNLSTGLTAANAIISTSLIAIGNSHTIGNIFTTGGNVGVGTSTPSSALDVNGSAVFRGTTTIVPISHTPFAISYINTTGTFPYGTNATSGTILLNSYDGGAFGGSWRPITLHGNVINLSTGLSNYNTRLHIADNGNVGINTTAPSFNLDVAGIARILNGITTGSLEVTGLADTLNLTATNSTISNLSVPGAFGAPNAYVVLYGLNVSTNITTGAMYSTAQTTTNIVGTNISSATLNLSTGLTSALAQITNSTITNLNANTIQVIGGDSGYIQTNRILGVTTLNCTSPLLVTSGSFSASFNSNTIGNVFTTGGNVGINMTSPSYNLHVNGDICASGDVISFSSISDKRLKTNIENLDTDNSLQTIKDLRPVTFNWSNDIFNEQKRSLQDVGFIAQEVEVVVPYAVSEYRYSENTYKNMKHERLIPYLVGAIQRLDVRTVELEKENELLQKRIDYLQYEINNRVTF